MNKGLFMALLALCVGYAILLWQARASAPFPVLIDAVYLGFITKGSVVSKTITLSSAGTGEMACWSDCQYVNVLPRYGGKQTRLVVTVDTNRMKAGPMRCNLYIRIGEPYAYVIRMPIIGIIQDASKSYCCAD